MIRTLTVADYENFLPLINDFRATTFTEEQFASSLATIQRSSTIWVIEEDGALLATGTIQYETKFIFNICKLAHIEDVCVKKEVRAKGLGKQLVTHLIGEAKAQGAYKITLDCAAENIGFYERCGFEKRGQQMTILC